jgi:hypothetical protein
MACYRDKTINMKNILSIFLFGFLTLSFVQAKEYQLNSPNNKITLKFWLAEGKAYYSVLATNNLVLEKSKLGLIRNDEDFSSRLSLTSISKIEVINDHYELFSGKRRLNSYTAHQQVFYLKTDSENKMEVIFRVSDEGVAFRYNFPDRSEEVKIINDETTTFNFPADTKSWLQPMSVAKSGWKQTNPSYEEYYQQEQPVGTPSPLNSGWVYPALFKTGDNWVLLTETFPEGNYCGTKLSSEAPEGEYKINFPDAKEVIGAGELNPQSKLPWRSPWRLITIGSLKTIVESSMGTDLAKASDLKNTDFVKPGLSSWSWALLKDDSTVYHVQKRFIDYAAAMKWPYCLIDADWDRKIGKEKIKELAEYANTKNVGLILWYNSAGDWNETPYTPKNKMLTAASRAEEFAWLKATGIKGVKVDFFGGDGQSNIAFYLEILKAAAEHQILVNFHGATLPRGLQRTYPNLVTMESVKGLEFRTFEQVNENVQAAHCTILPFTRNAFDPMDYTPMVLDKIPNIKRTTTSAFELALPVLFFSGVQHIAEIPEGMAKAPEYIKQLLTGFPGTWDEVRFIDGYPGKLCVIARKAGNKWYVAGINGESKEKQLELDLEFIKRKGGALITDGADSLNFSLRKISADKKTAVTVAANSGFVMVFE